MKMEKRKKTAMELGLEKRLEFALYKHELVEAVEIVEVLNVEGVSEDWRICRIRIESLIIETLELSKKDVL